MKNKTLKQLMILVHQTWLKMMIRLHVTPLKMMIIILMMIHFLLTKMVYQLFYNRYYKSVSWRDCHHQYRSKSHCESLYSKPSLKNSNRLMNYLNYFIFNVFDSPTSSNKKSSSCLHSTKHKPATEKKPEPNNVYDHNRQKLLSFVSLSSTLDK